MPLSVSSRRPLIAGNWKMNGLRRDGLDRVRALAARANERGTLGVDIAVFPPATLLVELRAALEASPIALGAQDCAIAEKGAYTGDLGAPMLADAGCRYVILGHSERRHGHGESDETVRRKAEAASAAGLVALICLGETQAERAAGQTLEVLGAELARSLPERMGDADAVIVYEPVWAIGSGLTPSREEIAEAQGFVRQRLSGRDPGLGERMRLLYGGSVTPSNAAEFMAITDVDGLLVGGASLDSADFWAICEASGA
ncbi:MAG: triose-phosphate isomerase [Proteobacteria bacterium]|nr:triose-phosphate isomerase [Pseudomonadota bacterium]